MSHAEIGKIKISILAMVLSLCFPTSPAMAEVSCDNWNTEAFFERASVADVSRCLEEGAEVNARDESGETPLHMAARHYPPEVVDILLKAGADVNARDSDGKTPLLKAAAYKQLYDVDTLLKAGADVNARGSDGKTPLHWAVGNAQGWTRSWEGLSMNEESPAVADALLKAGADVNARDKDGKTPLHLALESTETRSIDALLKAGADVDARAIRLATANSEIPPAVLESLKIRKKSSTPSPSRTLTEYAGTTPPFWERF